MVAVALLLLLTVLPLASAPAPPSPSLGQPGASIPEKLQRLLDDRATAVTNKDKAAYLATATAADQEHAGERFDGLVSAAPVYKLTLRWDLAGDLATSAVRRRYAPARAVVSQVDVRTSFPGFDSEGGAALTSDFPTFVETEDGWKIAADTDLESIGLLSTREIWDFGPVVATRSKRVLAFSHPAGKERAEGVVAAFEAALTRVTAGLPLPWSEKVVAIVPDGSIELGRILQTTVELSNFVGFAYWGIERNVPEHYRSASPRVILNPDTFFSYSPSVREDILVHELVHVATRGAAGPAVTSWLDEGIADVVATGVQSQKLPDDGELPEDWRFGVGGATPIREAYARSRSFVGFLSGIGPPLATFYVATGEKTPRPGSKTYRQDAATRAVFGRSLADLRSAWAGTL